MSVPVKYRWWQINNVTQAEMAQAVVMVDSIIREKTPSRRLRAAQPTNNADLIPGDIACACGITARDKNRTTPKWHRSAVASVKVRRKNCRHHNRTRRNNALPHSSHECTTPCPFAVAASARRTPPVWRTSTEITNIMPESRTLSHRVRRTAGGKQRTGMAAMSVNACPASGK